MKKVIIALTAIVAMASCKKEKLAAPYVDQSVTKKLVQATYVYDNGAPEIESYTYDAQGRIIEFKEDNRTTTFNYVSPASVIATEKKNADNSLNGTKECEINAKGYITKMVFKNPAGAVTYTYEYTYNAEGYMSGQKGIYPNGNTLDFLYSYADGNLVSSKLYYDNVFNSQTDYVYDKTKVNKFPVGKGAYWNVIQFWGKGSKNLATEIKATNTSGTVTWHRQMAFELDADGYAIKIIGTDMFSGKKGIDTYTYK